MTRLRLASWVTHKTQTFSPFLHCGWAYAVRILNLTVYANPGPSMRLPFFPPPFYFKRVLFYFFLHFLHKGDFLLFSWPKVTYTICILSLASLSHALETYSINQPLSHLYLEFPCLHVFILISPVMYLLLHWIFLEHLRCVLSSVRHYRYKDE